MFVYGLFLKKKHYTFSSKRSVNGWYAGYISIKEGIKRLLH
ncbi:hypothetical protein HMPREF9714_02579 [Myroides odoratimimus CCUG 12901]|nr:hypothetical protein HMPREF9714_02579 [Myroides odoratimimus CCUG 12901]